MRKTLAIIAIALLATACSGITTIDYTTPDTVINATLPAGDPAWEAQWQDEVWVFPASIQIGHTDPTKINQHYIAGVKIIYPIVIHANEQATQFHLSYQGADYSNILSTYMPSPAKTVSWVHFPEPDPYLQAYETREVPVEFFVPKNASAPARWNFYVKIDWEQTEFFQQARAIRFDINMKPINI